MGEFSARLTPDMGTRPVSEEKPSQRQGTEDGMVVLSYILAGLLFYGGLADGPSASKVTTKSVLSIFGKRLRKTCCSA